MLTDNTKVPLVKKDDYYTRTRVSFSVILKKVFNK